jgi:predicted Zn-dependent peptidase
MEGKMKPIRFLALISILLILPLTQAQNLADFEKHATEFSLANGLRFIVFERHDAPVVSCYTHVDVGSSDEVKGITGLAHIFEHMAFKGTKTIGTKNYQEESKVLAQVDKTFDELKEELNKGPKADQNRVKELKALFAKQQQEAKKYLVHDEFEEALKRQGATGLNAGTSYDYTVYMVNLPSNKLELWMMMESERFRDPVLREFYKERDVVMEERRMRTETQPIGRLLEDFFSVAYKAHPYGEPVIGHMSDLQNISRENAIKFFKEHYVPSNMVIGIVGDVDPVRVKELANNYFGRIPKRPKPKPVTTVEPPQNGERQVTIEDPSQPFVLVGYHRPGINHPDNAVFDAITDIMGSGRTSRLYKSLVKEKQLAMDASALQGIPGVKYPGMFLFYSIPARNRTNAENLKEIYAQIDRLKNEPVTKEELDKAKTRARAGLIRQLDSNQGLAEELTFYETLTGDWRNLFKQLDKIEKVTAEDIQRVAKAYFIKKNRTVGLIETAASSENSKQEAE